MNNVNNVKCINCNDKYFVKSNDEDGNDEIQKCDDCGHFSSDEEAQNYVREVIKNILS